MSSSTPAGSGTQSSSEQQRQQNESRNKMYIIILVILILVAAGGVAAIITLAVKGQKDTKEVDDTPAPTASPVAAGPGEPTPPPTPTEGQPISAPIFNDGQFTEEEQEVLLDVFSAAVGADVYVEGSTQAMAADWIFFQDPRRFVQDETTTTTRTATSRQFLEPDDQNALLQRYLLVYFYFSTTNNRNDPWRSCGEPRAVSVDDPESSSGCLYQKLVVPAYDDQLNLNDLVYTEIPWIRWLTVEHECDWAGVSCVTTIGNVRQVTGIDLAGQGLKGRLVSELLSLPSLKTLILSYNQFEGQLEQKYGLLATLEVAYNFLSGPLPEAMFRPTITLLERFNAGGNRLSGAIPLSLSFATHLKTLWIFDNVLVGTIPQVLGQLELSSFQAQGNQLVGSLPLDSNNVVWANSLEQFWVQSNNLEGGLPTQVSNFRRLEELRLSSNDLRGTIPESLYQVTSLVRLHLDQNSFTGTISPRLSALTSLEIFDASSNNLIGPMADVTGLTDLETVRIQFNQLSGFVPSSTCRLFIDGSLEDLEADCQPQSFPPITCECCTLCCNRQTRECGQVEPDDNELELSRLRSFALETFGLAIDLTSGSPHDLTIRWIALTDPFQLTIASELLLQRYIMTLFYYSTAPWRSCGPGNNPNIVSCVFERFQREQDDSIVFVPEIATRWLSAATECEWVGVSCNSNGNVVGVELFAQDLSGPIPTELTRLPGFRDLQVAYNLLTGTIPEGYGRLPSLTRFFVHGNMLSGTIPATFFEASNTLENIIVGDNFLEGTIPSSIGLKGSLVGFHAFSNNLSGTIPSSFYELTSLRFVRLSENSLTGRVSPGFGNLLRLQELWLHSNSFTGTIPTELSRVAFALNDLRLEFNRLTGSIPSELGLMTPLRIFRVDSNQFTGTIPSELAIMTNLEQLRLSSNDLTGTVPTELGLLGNLVLLWLHRNNLVGTVPAEICILPFIQFLQTDCVELTCDCCTACCFDGDPCNSV